MQKKFIQILKSNKKICKDSLKKLSIYSKEYYLKYLLLLLKSTHVSFDSNALSELKYLYFKNLQNNIFVKFILWSIGYLQKPNRIILSSIATILFFSILYFLMSSEVQNLIQTGAFIAKSSLPKIFDNLKNSFYFSGITFFTIGYGDELCVPNSFQWVKSILIFLEAGIGVSFFASFVLGLSNKYLIFLKHDS